MRELAIKRLLEYIKMQLEDIINDLCEDCPYKDTDCSGGLWCDK